MSTTLSDSLQSTVTKPCVLAKLTIPLTGTEYGFTSNVEPIEYSGLVYQPDEGIRLSSIATSLGAGVDNASVSGNETIRIGASWFEDDQFDGAKFEVMLMNLMVPTAGVRVLLSGEIGDFAETDGEWEAAFRGWSAKIKQTQGELSSKTCTCQRLGDKRCKLNLVGTVRGRSIQSGTKSVSAIVSSKKFRVGSESAPSDFYTFGSVRFTSGDNSGRTYEIKEHKLLSGSVAEIELRTTPVLIQSGDTLVLTAGCNRKKKYESVEEPRLGSTCEEFGNTINFRGQHELPSNSQIGRVASA